MGFQRAEEPVGGSLFRELNIFQVSLLFRKFRTEHQARHEHSVETKPKTQTLLRLPQYIVPRNDVSRHEFEPSEAP